MKVLNAPDAAREAVAAHPARPATALLHDHEDVRLVLFRIAPGQAVAPHTSPSSVVLHVVSGSGLVSGDGDERPVAPGDLVAYAPQELHGMRALAEELVIVAAIAPRPGGR